MKKYKIKLWFLEGTFNYEFWETLDKNPKGEILFEGMTTGKRKMYVLHYTEYTLLRMGAQLLTDQPVKQ